MTDDHSPYHLSRWNSLSYGTHHDGPIPCLGLDRCKLKHCEHTRYEVPGHGEPCPWESDYRRAYVTQMTRTWQHKAEAAGFDLEAIVSEAANLALKRLRSSIRSNQAWVFSEDATLPASFFHEDELSSRYYVSLINQERDILEQLCSLTSSPCLSG